MHSCTFTCTHDITVECICCTLYAIHVSVSLACLCFLALTSFCVANIVHSFFNLFVIRRLLVCFSKTV